MLAPRWGYGCPRNAHCWGKVSLAKVISRYYLSRTVLPRVKLFNDRVLELQTGYAFVGRILNAY
jgi:hypothetical protein